MKNYHSISRFNTAPKCPVFWAILFLIALGSSALFANDEDNPCVEEGPYYGAWKCKESGSFGDPSEYEISFDCVGQTLDGWNASIAFDHGTERRTIEYDCDDNEEETRTASYTISDVNWEPSFPYTFKNAGTFIFRGYASATTDSACSDVPETLVAKLTVTVSAPELWISVSPDPVCPGETVTLTANTNCSGGEYEWSGDVSGSQASISTSFEDPGIYVAMVTYKLHDVKVSRSKKIFVKEPTITVEASPSPAYVGESVTFISSADCGAEFSHWSGAAAEDNPRVFATPGLYTATAHYTLNGSMYSESTTVTVKPITVTAEVNPVPGCVGDVVSFVASGTPANGSYTWTGAVSGGGSNKTQVFTEPDTYEATVVYNYNGFSSEPVTVEAPVRQVLLSAWADPSAAEVNETIEFSASVNCGTGSFLWEGAVIGGGETVSKSFSTPGVYSARVTYTALAGVERTAEVTVVVACPEGYSGPDEGEVKIQGERVTGTIDHPLRGTVATEGVGWWLVPLSAEEPFEMNLSAGIVTINTPEPRTLEGTLNLTMLTGDPTIAEMYYDEQQIGFPWSGPVSNPGHAGCGVHHWHTSSRDFEFYSFEPGTWTLEASVDPDEGYSFKTSTIHVVFARGLVPDYNRDGRIDEEDGERFDTMHDENDKATFHFWVNDNEESSESGGDDIPGSSNPDYATESVNTVRDLIDFFPVSIELGDFMQEVDQLSDVEISLRAPKLNRIVQTIQFVSPESSNSYLTNTGMATQLAQRSTEHLDDWTDLAWFDLHRISQGYSVLLFEGREPGLTKLEMRVKYQGETIGEFELPIKLSPVEEMYRHVNLLDNGGGDENEGRPTEWFAAGDGPPGFPDWEVADKNFVFVHGYNVNPEQARGWNSAMFRRFYWSGLNARFHGVTWYGAESQIGSLTPDYHINVVNAFRTSEAFATFLNDLNPAPAVAAHSLGNMLVSSAITDHSASVERFFMLNPAVAKEAYEELIDSNYDYMVHHEWHGAGITGADLRRLWASRWHELFTGTGDNRQLLTWRGRFDPVLNIPVYNFYSSGEEVFAAHESNRRSSVLTFAGAQLKNYLYDSSLVFWTDGEPLGQYSWAYQEKLKGRTWTGKVLGSKYGGWGINPDWDRRLIRWDPPWWTGVGIPVKIVRNIRSPFETGENTLTDEMLKTDPFFRPNAVPELYDSSTGSGFVMQPAGNYDKFFSGGDYGTINLHRLLAEMIPAESRAAGGFAVGLFTAIPNAENFDMTGLKPGGAWVSDRPNQRWLHSDIREIAFPFTHLVFEKIIEQGNLGPE